MGNSAVGGSAGHTRPSSPLTSHHITPAHRAYLGRGGAVLHVALQGMVSGRLLAREILLMLCCPLDLGGAVACDRARSADVAGPQVARTASARTRPASIRDATSNRLLPGSAIVRAWDRPTSWLRLLGQESRWHRKRSYVGPDVKVNNRPY
jgi:hypothetical protein